MNIKEKIKQLTQEGLDTRILLMITRQSEEIDKLEKRIERLEKHPKRITLDAIAQILEEFEGDSQCSTKILEYVLNNI